MFDGSKKVDGCRKAAFRNTPWHPRAKKDHIWCIASEVSSCTQRQGQCVVCSRRAMSSRLRSVIGCCCCIQDGECDIQRQNMGDKNVDVGGRGSCLGPCAGDLCLGVEGAEEQQAGEAKARKEAHWVWSRTHTALRLVVPPHTRR